MRIAVISDLHLGAGQIDQFGHDEIEFLKFLKFLEDNFERIVLLGDIYETLMPATYGDFKTSLVACREAHLEIVKRFERPCYTYVYGNHDWITSKLMKAPDEYRIVADGQRIVFRHGHQHDRLIQKARFVSEFGIWFGGWLLRMGIKPIYKLVTMIDEGSAAASAFTKFEKMAAESCPGADIVVNGHTHIPKRVEWKSHLYLNSGTCSNGRYSFLSIDTKTGTYQTNTAW